MRKYIVAGNWKMHGTPALVSTLLADIKEGGKKIQDVQVVVFPPYIFLPYTQEVLAHSNLKWGAQNVYPALEGAVTGEISISMLQDFGCEYVLVGHSERRHLLGETNEQVITKFLMAGEYGLKPILCLGETYEERQASQTFEVIRNQLAPLLEETRAISILENAIIAYEPVWAIGTGLTATPLQAQEVHQFIRQEIEKKNKTLAEKLSILYGGSVKQDNAAALFAMPDIDGGLIGGASLNAKEFLDIVKLCNSH